MHKTATWFFTMWVQNLATCYLDRIAMGGASTNSGKITWASLDKAAAFVGEKVSEVQLNDVDARRFHTKLGGFWDDGRNPKGGGERRFHPCRFQLRVSQQEQCQTFLLLCSKETRNHRVPYNACCDDCL